MILHDTFAATPLDRTSLPQGNLDIAERVRTNPFPWTGQFSPQLVERLLTAYAPRNGIVLDPFVGSGTSLVEAARLDLPACGGDLNERRGIAPPNGRHSSSGSSEKARLGGSCASPTPRYARTLILTTTTRLHTERDRSTTAQIAHLRSS